MSQYDDSNKGAVWKNDKRETDKHPHLTGQANIDGKEYWVSGWKRDADANDKAPVLRLAFTPKDAKASKPAPKQTAPADDLDDDLGF